MNSRWVNWAYASSFSFALLGCGEEESTETPSSAFAAYWADSSEWCAFFAKCGVQERGACEESWATASETEAALAAAKVKPAEVERCETATHSLDDCALKLSCDDYQAGEVCKANGENFQIACAPVNAAIESYLNEHRTPPFHGPFAGEYLGDEAGTFTGELRADGTVSLDISSPSLGEVNGEGTINFSGTAEFEVSGDVADGDYLLNFTGNVSGNGPSFSGDGSWVSNASSSGSWTLTSSAE